MVIFNSYVKSPEGTPKIDTHHQKSMEKEEEIEEIWVWEARKPSPRCTLTLFSTFFSGSVCFTRVDRFRPWVVIWFRNSGMNIQKLEMQLDLPENEKWKNLCVLYMFIILYVTIYNNSKLYVYIYIYHIYKYTLYIEYTQIIGIGNKLRKIAVVKNAHQQPGYERCSQLFWIRHRGNWGRSRIRTTKNVERGMCHVSPQFP